MFKLTKKFHKCNTRKYTNKKNYSGSQKILQIILRKSR